jgi:hypothetical protein
MPRHADPVDLETPALRAPEGELASGCHFVLRASDIGHAPHCGHFTSTCSGSGNRLRMFLEPGTALDVPKGSAPLTRARPRWRSSLSCAPFLLRSEAQIASMKLGAAAN